MSSGENEYFIPDPSPWPIITMVSIFSFLLGMAFIINGVGFGWIFLIGGVGLLAYIFFWLVWGCSQGEPVRQI